ncbi:MAG: hypothetical protein ACR2O6_05390, partial [Ilumatobacteraceae bacterium]
MRNATDVGRRPVAVAILAALAVGGALHVADGDSASADGAVRRQDAVVVVDLLDQDIAFVADASLRLVYQLSGELDIAAELAPAPTTTVPPTTLPDPEEPDGAPDEEAE